MHDLRRFFETGGGLFDPQKDITQRQLYGLGLFLSSAVTLGCLSFGLDPQIAFMGGVGALLSILLIAALTDRG
ncbi:hypothetical protein [Longimicrobium sp.]|uniref:hypothetical protein n=1 Tax=Longimicrobium sp. TaxID=2029185 RepID=UPI002F92E1E2